MWGGVKWGWRVVAKSGREEGAGRGPESAKDEAE